VPPLAFVSREELEGLLACALGISPKVVNAVVGALVFDPKRKNLEIWDQPLMPFGPNVAISPALVSSGDPARAVENIARQWNSLLLPSRGHLFEKSIAEEFARHGVGRVVSGRKCQGTEFDFVWIWDGHVFLIEAKCFTMVIDGGDAHHAREEMEKAFAQLDVRTAFVREHWGEFRQCMGADGINETCDDQKLHGVVLLNDPCFTGYRRDGYVVTDFVALKRYFGDPAVNAFAMSRSHGTVRGPTVGRVRDDDGVDPVSLVNYLRRPGQVEGILDLMRYGPIALPRVSESSQGVVIFDYEMVPAEVAVGSAPENPATDSETARTGGTAESER
jgi:hypothetical protein